MKHDAQEFELFSHVVVIDTREQFPFAFTGLQADAAQGHRPLIVQTQAGTLQSGDYSILGAEAEVAIERKSLDDLYGTIGQGRERFERELARLQEIAASTAYSHASVVIEAGWGEIIGAPPRHTRLAPKTVSRSIQAWTFRFPLVHWWTCVTRRHAESVTFRLLERFTRERQRELLAAIKAARAAANLATQNTDPTLIPNPSKNPLSDAAQGAPDVCRTQKDLTKTSAGGGPRTMD